MAHRRIVYRDYRKGREGKFASKAAFNRSQAQGTTCHIHREYIKEESIDSVEDLYAIEDEPDLEEYEYHGTGDTGRRRE